MITKEYLKDTRIRVNPEQSRKVQELAFSLGFAWAGDEKKLRYLNKPFLFLNNMYICYCSDESYFNDSNKKEIFYKDLFPKITDWRAEFK